MAIGTNGSDQSSIDKHFRHRERQQSVGDGENKGRRKSMCAFASATIYCGKEYVVGESKAREEKRIDCGTLLS